MADYNKNFLIQIKDLNNNALFPKTKASLVEGFDKEVQTFLLSTTGENLIKQHLSVNSAMVFKGTADGSFLVTKEACQIGWTYVVNLEENLTLEINGKPCENGDMVICNKVLDKNKDTGVGRTDKTCWSVILTNIDGAVRSTETLTDDAFILGSGNQTIKTASVDTVVDKLKDKILAALSISEGTGITISTDTNSYTIGISSEYLLTPANVISSLSTVLGTGLTLGTKDVDGQEVTVLSASVDLSPIQNDILALGTRVTTAEGKISTVEGKVGTLEGQVGTLESQVADIPEYVGKAGITLATIAEGEDEGKVAISFNYDSLSDDEKADLASGIANKLPGATTSQAGLMSIQQVSDLETLNERVNGIINTGGEANQNAFSNIVVGTTTVKASAVTDTIELFAGAGIELSYELQQVAAEGTEGEAGYQPAYSKKVITLGASVDTSALEGDVNKAKDDIYNLYMLHGSWNKAATYSHTIGVSVSPSTCAVGKNASVNVTNTWNSNITTVAEGETKAVTYTLNPENTTITATEPINKPVTATFNAPAGSYERNLVLSAEAQNTLGLSTNVLKTESINNVGALTNETKTATVYFKWPTFVYLKSDKSDSNFTNSSNWTVNQTSFEKTLTPVEGNVYVAVPGTLNSVQFYALGQWMDVNTDNISAPEALASWTYTGDYEVTASNVYKVYTISGADAGKYKFNVTL